MFAVDTNVLLYAANRECAEHDRCEALLRGWCSQALPWFVSWGVLYEFFRVSTHRRVFPEPLTAAQALRFVQALLGSPALTVLEHTDRHAQILALTVAELPDLGGNAVHDAHLAVLMREHGIRRVYTRDTGFRRFDFVEVIDPMSSGPG